METLWAPWRIEYILSEKPDECIFCEKPAAGAAHDEDHYILFRAERCFVILNAFPYNNGHLMVVPYQHEAELDALPPEVLGEVMQVTARCTRLLRESFRADGFNVGLNQGRVAGAGIEEHLHVHVVPRWNGDTNFMPVIGQTKVLPEALRTAYEKLRPCFAAWERKKP
jgi:ATP adenylyltransferase